MEGAYKNNFLKQFSLLWILVITVLIFLVNMVINISFEKIKSNYINESYALAGSFINIENTKEDKVAAIFTQGTSYEVYEKGKQILSSYGYKEDMDIKLIPQVNKSYESLKLNINVILFFSMTILYLIVFFFYKKISAFVTMLNLGIKKIIEGDFSLKFSFIGEGQFNILAHNFNQMAERLENALMELTKDKNFLKDTLSNISHQLKTPITSMNLFTEALINNSAIEKEDIEKLGFKMRSSLYRMEWLIKKLLKLARLEGGVVEYNKTNHCFKETIQKAVEPLLVSIEEKNINFRTNIQEAAFPHDKEWTSEALTNIIKNSIEHTKQNGEISVSFESNSAYHKITVSDNGDGIDKEDLPHIFERFYKGKGKSPTKKTDSIGIGLALSKSIIEGQGGFLEVESIKERGSKFTVTFLTNS